VPASGIPLPFLFPAAAPVALPVASEEKKGGVPDLLAPAQPINGYQADLGLGLSLFFFLFEKVYFATSKALIVAKI